MAWSDRKFHLSGMHHGLKRRARASAGSSLLADRVDMRPEMPSVYDQGQIGSCTANAAAAVLEHLDPGSKPCPLFIYLMELREQGIEGQDEGASMETLCEVISSYGACRRGSLANGTTPKALETKVSKAAFVEAIASKNWRPVAVDHVLEALADGHPVVCGIYVFQGIESDGATKTGVVPDPKLGEEPLGGHAVVLVGYDLGRRVYIFRNSWGADWGDKGYGYLSLGYVERHASGFFRVEHIVDLSKDNP